MLVIRSICRHHVAVSFRCGLKCISIIRFQSNNGSISNALPSSLGNGNIVERYGRQHIRSPFPTIICALSQVCLNNATGLIRPSNANITFIQKRHKSGSSRKRKREAKDTEGSIDGEISDSDDSPDDDDDDDDDDANDDVKPKGIDREKPFLDVDFTGDAMLSSNYKMLKGNLSQPRYDSMCRFGFRISSKKFLNDLSEQKCKLNGLPLKLKRTIVKSGDALDVMVDNDEMRRIRVVSLDQTSPRYTVVCLKVWKAPFSKSLVKDLE